VTKTLSLDLSSTAKKPIDQYGAEFYNEDEGKDIGYMQLIVGGGDKSFTNGSSKLIKIPKTDESCSEQTPYGIIDDGSDSANSHVQKNENLVNLYIRTNTPTGL
jgi:hypothetical protein